VLAPHATTLGASARTPSETLPRSAVYADLVRSAGELEGAARPASSCLLGRDASDYRLRAELASAVRPLPQPASELDEVLKGVVHVELLSAWGRHGDGNGKLALVGFTRSAPTREAYALLVTSRGIALRSPSGSRVSPVDDLDRERALATLLKLDQSQEASVYVTAEAGVPVDDVYALLAALAPTGRNVVLAVSLTPNTTLPLPVSATAKVARCPDGLSATDRPEGSLPGAALLAGLQPLRERATDCLTRGDARGAAGGRLTVALRVAETGGVQEACIQRDELGDPGVLACVLDLAGQLSFAAPTPSGVIDIELPVALHAPSLPAPHPVCGSDDR
jgi:hypothetical protein